MPPEPVSCGILILKQSGSLAISLSRTDARNEGSGPSRLGPPEASFEPPAPVKWNYDRAELIADGIVHALGLKLAIIGVTILVVLATYWAQPLERVAIGIYSIALLSVLGISATYNLWPISPVKWTLRRFDHAAIYVLIAGTYTPFLTRLESGAGTVLAGAVWTIAVVGVVLKLLLPGRFDRLAIALYLGLGWSGTLAGQALLDALDPVTLALIALGGVIYSAGVVFHLWESLRFQNAVWHGFVLLGSCFLYGAVLNAMVLARF